MQESDVFKTLQKIVNLMAPVLGVQSLGKSSPYPQLGEMSWIFGYNIHEVIYLNCENHNL